MKKLTITYFILIGSINSIAQNIRPEINWFRTRDTIRIEKAIQFFQQGKYVESKNEIQKLPYRLYFNEAGVRYLSAQCSYMLGNYEEASALYSISLGYSPQSIGIYYDRGLALMNWSQFKGAASDFAAYLIHFPDDKDAISYLAYCLAKDGQPDNGIKYLESYSNKDSTLLNDLAMYYVEYKDNHKRAIELWKSSLELYPQFYTALENISISYLLINDYENAFKYIKKLIEVSPNSGKAYYLQGSYFEAVSLYTQAEESYRIARERGYTWDEETEFEDNDR